MQRYAELHDMDFVETSAKNNKNVREAFVRLATEICEIKSQQSPQTLPGYDPNPSLSLGRDTHLLEDAEDDNNSCSC